MVDNTFSSEDIIRIFSYNLEEIEQILVSQFIYEWIQMQDPPFPWFQKEPPDLPQEFAELFLKTMTKTYGFLSELVALAMVFLLNIWNPLTIIPLAMMIYYDGTDLYNDWMILVDPITEYFYKLRDFIEEEGGY